MYNHQYIFQISKLNVLLISHLLSEQCYKSDEDIIYKGHIPHCAFLLIKGKITLEFSKYSVLNLNQGALIGAYELLNYQAVDFKASIESNSLVYLIDKTILDDLFKKNILDFKLLN